MESGLRVQHSSKKGLTMPVGSPEPKLLGGGPPCLAGMGMPSAPTLHNPGWEQSLGSTVEGPKCGGSRGATARDASQLCSL